MFFGKKKDETNKEAEKSNFVVVLHSWFVDSKGFQQFIFKDMTRAEVEKEAKILTHDKSETFNKCAYTIVEFK